MGGLAWRSECFGLSVVEGREGASRPARQRCGGETPWWPGGRQEASTFEIRSEVEWQPSGRLERVGRADRRRGQLRGVWSRAAGRLAVPGTPTGGRAWGGRPRCLPDTRTHVVGLATRHELSPTRGADSMRERTPREEEPGPCLDNKGRFTNGSGCVQSWGSCPRPRQLKTGRRQPGGRAPGRRQVLPAPPHHLAPARPWSGSPSSHLSLSLSLAACFRRWKPREGSSSSAHSELS